MERALIKRRDMSVEIMIGSQSTFKGGHKSIYDTILCDELDR
jgi:hypothetical protein